MAKIRNIPTVFVIFGATGDLMGRKIIPALFHLYRQKKLPSLFKIIGFSRRDWQNKQFQEYVSDILKNQKDRKAGTGEIEAFLKLILYQKGDFTEIKSYTVLAEFLGRFDNEWKVCSNKLFYLAVPPQYYKKILLNLAESGLTIPCSPEEGYTRVLIEKPFGHDQSTAEELDTLLGKLFKEEQVYRIDHYLAKEMLQNILGFRFSNNLFEKMWDNRSIEKIEVRLLESIGVEGRGAYYDAIGALRDVGQNHLLQMLSLVTMDRPETLESASVRKKRAEILETLKTLTNDGIKQITFRAQYKEYRHEEGVSPDSNTETYFKVLGGFANPKWSGVPVILEGGKNLINQKEIVVTFIHPTPCLCPPSAKEHYKNKVIFRLEPKEEIEIEFWAKKPGLDFQMQKQTFNYLHRDARRKVQYIEEYEKLLLDCITGNQLLFVSTPEVQAMWKFIDPIICVWDEDGVPLHFYDSHKKKILQEAENSVKVEPYTRVQALNKSVGVVGLGKMGGGIARNLLEKGWDVVAYNRTVGKTQEFEKEGGKGAYTLPKLVEKLQKPRIIILSLPAGKATDEVLFGQEGLAKILEPGDFIINTANEYYKHTIEHYKKIEALGLKFVDVGISGGPEGARYGACLIVGGKKENFEYLESLFKEMSIENGYQFFEGVGSGHFVKMVHNGIEYGMMQAIAEGFAILKNATFNLDLTKVSEIYNNGSVIESRLIKWLQEGLKIYGQDLKPVSGTVERSGEGDWTVKTARELGIKAKIIEDAVNFRKESVNTPSYTGKILSVMRNMFGGHKIK